MTDAHVSVGEHGRYCFRGLGFAFRAAQVLIDYGDPLAGGSDNVGAQVPKGDPRSDCGAGNQLVVATSHGRAASAAGFYVWFFA